MKRIVIDSCVYISQFGKDKFSPQSRLFFQKLSQTDTKIIIPALVWAETIVVLRQNGAKNLEKISQIFSQLKFSAINKDTIEELTTLLKTGTSNLKTSDLVIALTTRINEATLVTWDDQLLNNNICQAASPVQYKT